MDSYTGNCEEELPKKPVGRHITDSLPTGYRQLTDRPTVGRHTADSRPTVGRLSVDRRPTVDRQSTDRFFGEVFFTITHTLVLTVNSDSPSEKVKLDSSTPRKTPTYSLHSKNLYLDFPKIHPTIAALQQN